jgi:hypothetical protein
MWQEIIFTAKSKMPSDKINILRAVGAASDLPSFVQLCNSKACEALFRSIEDGDDFERQRRRGYTALVLAALSRGLQLYNNAAAPALGQGASPAAAALFLDRAQLVNKLCLLSMIVLTNTKLCLMHWGEGSREAQKMEQELLDSGAHAEVLE